MGDVCCKGNVEGDTLEDVPKLMFAAGEGRQQEPLSDTANEPSENFAKPYTDSLLFLPKIDQRSKQLGPFQYPSGRSAPQGKNLPPHKLNNGTIYSGEWKAGQIHGKGLYLLPNQTAMYCLTSHNKINGRGRVIYPNGDYYEGNIVDGQAEGQGKYVEGAICYTGEFSENKIHGEGVEKGPNYEFEGLFERGQKTYGKLKWMVNGQASEYVGQFVDGLMEGKGTLTSGEGKYVGTFRKGLKHGQGKFFFKNNNQYYEGSFYNDNRHGQGAIIDEIDGRVLVSGNWFNDVYQK